MSYSCYLGGVEWPTPAKLTVKIKGKNKTLTLQKEGEYLLDLKKGESVILTAAGGNIPVISPVGGEGENYFGLK